MILLIDNYDSFSYNLYQMIGEIKPDIKVIRNDEMTAGEISGLGQFRNLKLLHTVHRSCAGDNTGNTAIGYCCLLLLIGSCKTKLSREVGM